MPSLRLSDDGAVLPRFAIVGTYSEPSDGNFVRHVGLLQEDAHVVYNSGAKVWQVAPPIVSGPLTAAVSVATDDCVAHLASYLVDLTVEESQGIETILAEIDAQTPLVDNVIAALFRHYQVSPPDEWVRDEITQKKRYRKFSCVGFVLACYRDGAGIPLLTDDRAKMPQIDLETLASAYGTPVEQAAVRKRLGLHGEGPWPVYMAGYIFHSLARRPTVVRTCPFVASSANETQFPLNNDGHGKCSPFSQFFKWLFFPADLVRSTVQAIVRNLFSQASRRRD